MTTTVIKTTVKNSKTSKMVSESLVAFQLKGGLYPLTAIQLLSVDLSLFEKQLVEKISQAPKFFHQAPIVIDLQLLKTSTTTTLDFDQLSDILKRYHLIAVGIKGADLLQQQAATKAGLAILQDSKQVFAQQSTSTMNVVDTNAGTRAYVNTSADHSTATNSSLSAAAKAIKGSREKGSSETSSETKGSLETETCSGSNTVIITKPVRSGQQIYAREADLIVIGSVSHGAELLADGNIHVYGPLRGRALAGVTGDQLAHIFCQSLEAELISIAGQYKISEDIEPTYFKKIVDIALKTGHLQIKVF